MEQAYWELLNTCRISLSSRHFVFPSSFPAFSLVLVNLLVFFLKPENLVLINNLLQSLYSCSLIYFSGFWTFLTNKIYQSEQNLKAVLWCHHKTFNQEEDYAEFHGPPADHGVSVHKLGSSACFDFVCPCLISWLFKVIILEEICFCL